MNSSATDMTQYRAEEPSASRADISSMTTGPVLPTFLRFVGASVVGLLALSSAAIVDGVAVGKMLGPEALAAVNLLIPFFTLVFGVALMLAIGGSVEAGHQLGAGRADRASAAFVRSLLAVLVFAALVVGVGVAFTHTLLGWLAVPEALRPLVAPYFSILLMGVPPQLVAVVLYYFLRMSGHPASASRALLAGAAVNIVLDVVLLVGFKLDLRAAAWATLLAQVTQFSLLLLGFCRARTALSWRLRGLDWRRLVGNSLNGFSEFLNEVSAGLVLLAIHWLLSRSDGVQGVAGFALINYSLLVNVMLGCAVAEVVHVLVSHNRGAGLSGRALAFRRCGLWTVMLGGAALYGLVHLGAEPVSRWFFAEDSRSAAEAARTFWPVVAPVFLLTGANLVLSAWFTGLQRPLYSALISLSRSLVLPLAFLFVIVGAGASVHFLWSLPLAEAFTLLLAFVFLSINNGSLSSR